MARPFISVLIDTYNHERFIEQALSSVLEQDLAESEREVVVVDDASTDRTADLVRRFEARGGLVRKMDGGGGGGFYNRRGGGGGGKRRLLGGGGLGGGGGECRGRR